MKPSRTSSATASTRPEPHRPWAATSPITPTFSSPLSILIVSMAPSAARMPHLICAASNAGPAGAAVVSTRSALPSTISQFVPTSMKRRMRLSRVMPVARMPATMSPPT